MNKKILLLKIEYTSYDNPLGLLYVGSYLKNNGYDVKLEIIHSTMFKNDSFCENKAREIEKEGYLFVGFSVLTGPQTKYSATLSKKIKEFNKDLPIVWGGIHPSLMYEQTLKEKYVDVVVIGEGERTALELADAFSQNRGLADIGGIGYKKNGSLIFNKERELIKDIDEIKIDWPLLESFIGIEKCLGEIQGQDMVNILYISSRGCPHNCSFCYNKAFNKRRWRAHSVERVISDISYLKKKYNIRHIVFMDDHFFVNKNRSYEILSRMKDMGVVCDEFLLRIDEVTEDAIKRLSDLGVKRLFIGIESGNDRVLSLMNKNTTRNMILDKFSILSKYKDVAINAAMIVGYPTETLKEIWDSVDLGLELASMLPGIVVTYQIFLPYPGTESYQLALKEGFRPPIATEDYEVYDTFGNTMPLTWLKWADKNIYKLFYRIDKYGKLLTHSESTSAIRTLGKKFFYYLARFRFKHRFFAFPFELFFLFKFNRYYNPKCRI